AAVDPDLADLQLLDKLRDGVTVEHETDVARRRSHGGYGRELPVRAVEVDEPPEVDVRDAVAVGHHERLAEPGREPLQAPRGLGLDPRVEQVDEPVVLCSAVNLEFAVGDVEAEVVAEVVVVEEVVLDDVGLVAEGDDELVEAG